jgi:hypothetical protein
MFLTILAIVAILFHTYFCMNLVSPRSLRARWYYFPLTRAIVTLLDLAGAYALGRFTYRIGHWKGVAIALSFYFVIWPLFWFVLSMRRLSKLRANHSPRKETRRAAAKRTGAGNRGGSYAKRKARGQTRRTSQVKALADLIFASVSDNVRQEFLRPILNEDYETMRARFCFSLLNLFNVIWLVNKFEKDNDTQREILDGLLSEFMSRFESDTAHFQIKDLIPWAQEQRYLASNFRITKTNMSNYRTIMPIIYEYRLRPYYDAMDEIAAAAAAAKKATATFSVDPATKLFLLHFSGKNDIEDLDCAKRLSSYLLGRQPTIIRLTRFILSRDYQSTQ